MLGIISSKIVGEGGREGIVFVHVMFGRVGKSSMATTMLYGLGTEGEVFLGLF